MPGSFGRIGQARFYSIRPRAAPGRDGPEAPLRLGRALGGGREADVDLGSGQHLLLEDGEVWGAYDEWHRFMKRWDQILPTPLWVLIGTAAMLGVAFWPRPRPGDPAGLRWLRRYRYTWLFVGLVLLGLTLFFGVNPSGAGLRFWLGGRLPLVGGVYFQPSELLKLLAIVFIASYMAEKRELIQYRAGRDCWSCVISFSDKSAKSGSVPPIMSVVFFDGHSSARRSSAASRPVCSECSARSSDRVNSNPSAA